MNREEKILQELRDNGNLRQLRDTHSQGAFIYHQDERYVNLSSNDYLGISSTELQKDFLRSIDPEKFIMSNPSSRLMTGNSTEYQELESMLASMYGTEAALVLGSGFLLNCGLLPAITTEKDVIIADKQVHASIIDGLKLSPARHERFRHNDMNHLESLLKKTDAERIIVATESLFSMDGDVAPLVEIAELQKKYDFELYLDEAHAMGVWGKDGRGLSAEYADLRVDYLVATFGKAICSQGAFVACNKAKKELVVNRMRTLIYSTALPPVSLIWTKFILERLPTFESERHYLRELIGIMGGKSQIIPHVIGDSQRTLQRAEELRAAGYWVTAIRKPTVAEGTERLRFSLTAAHTRQQIEELCSLLG